MPNKDIAEIISVYDSKIVKSYCWGRFKIMHQQFLDELGQYLPERGQILDMGCGFGLFSLYYATKLPGLSIIGIDINADRIQMAKKAASALSLSNVRYEVADAITYECSTTFTGAYMLDIVHHISPETVRPLVRKIHASLPPGGRLLIKDVKTEPAYKRWFTFLLDKLLDPQSQLNYWKEQDMIDLLTAEGFEVFRHAMVDILPYPHILYICQKKLP
jgi:2-polyprenyl-3-methyl-5-hydroxy-6-metoxy-1,4-benzoquinol methylase